MASIQPKTYHAKPGDVERHWFVIDAAGQTVGRLASRVAHILRGKHKPQFTPSIDVGDFVIIINAEKIVFKGDKMDDKIYYRTTTRPGSMKKINARALLEKNPTKILEDAIWGMVPHNTLGRAQIRKLNVYAGETHPHQAQTPQVLEPTAIGVG